MTLRRLRGAPPLVFLLLLAPIAAARSVDAAETCATAQCHAKLVQGTDVHPATEDCTSCHQSVAEPHPQTGKKTFELVAQAPELCYNCHDPFGKKKQVHDPVASGDCTTCHDPHSSNNAKLLTAPVAELCTSCHSDIGGAKHPHGPVAAGACTSCHSPHESDVKPLLLKAGQDLCFGCHGDLQKTVAKANVHPALEDGCTTCHQPHGSDQPKLLAEAMPELCFQCHDDVADKVQKSPVVHAAVASEHSCATCHSPHAADEGSLLLESEKETCLGCHPNVVTAAMKDLHQPVAAGRCTSCHDPHGAQYPKLLKKEFPAGDYVPYSDTEFELCFSCHNRDLVRYPDTSFATNFRDGARNLHYLHVNQQKGRSCVLCHQVHGSPNPKLIADSVPFGKWQLPIHFEKTATGGSCAPGCHQPQRYERGEPVGSQPAPPAASSN